MLDYWLNREQEHANAIVNLKIMRDSTEGDEQRQVKNKIQYHATEQSNCLGEIDRLRSMA